MKKSFVIFLLTSFFLTASAQDDLLNMLDENAPDDINYTSATFKSTRIMNGHSIERMPEGQLDFRISHRFGRINTGFYEFFGLDQSNIHFSLEYGFTKWFMAGIGRGSYDKTFDAFGKFSILRQSSGTVNMPVSLSVVTTAALKTIKFPDQNRTNYFSSRMAYTAQLLVARKFNQAFSFQVTPSYVHRNLVATELDPNDIYAVGVGGRIKLTKRASFNGEYYYMINPKDGFNQPVFDPLALGFDIETGGHVFQLILTNSLGMIEKAFIGETTGSWGKGDIHFGFNISRVFTVKKGNQVDRNW